MKTYKTIFKNDSFIQLRYMSASIFPAIVGSLLPFWLLKQNFTFKWLSALEFLISMILFHLAFIIFNEISLAKRFEIKSRNKLFITAMFLLFLSFLIGIHINYNINLQEGVPSFIFIVYWAATLFAAILYVAPPFSFNKKIGGEVIIAEGLGMLPLIGAYLVQVGDITRTVYIASLPIVVLTFLWVWIIEIINKDIDEHKGKNNLVILFGSDFAGQFGTPIITLVFIGSIFSTILSSSVSPFFLIIVLFFWMCLKIISNTRQNYLFPLKIKKVEKMVAQLHLATCLIISITSVFKSG